MEFQQLPKMDEDLTLREQNQAVTLSSSGTEKGRPVPLHSFESTSCPHSRLQPSADLNRSVPSGRFSTSSADLAHAAVCLAVSGYDSNGHYHPSEIVSGNDVVERPAEDPLGIIVNTSNHLEPSQAHKTKPQRSILHLSSLDSLISYREEMALWNIASVSRETAPMDGDESQGGHSHSNSISQTSGITSVNENFRRSNEILPSRFDVLGDGLSCGLRAPRVRFRHIVAEIGFCFTIAMTQFLCEYLVSGFAIELPRLANRYAGSVSGSMGLFWPASLLTLMLSATLLFWARVSDMYGGYLPFMFGALWLAIWTLVPGFVRSYIVMDIARAMQGIAIAAFIPSTFAMVGSIYPEGSRRNFVLGLYSGCAPLGFFTGFLVASALETPQWYFWIASILSLTTLITGFLTVPSDRTDRSTLALKMDWIGALLIAGGLMAISYALAVEPNARRVQSSTNGWSSPMVAIPLAVGLIGLAVAFWYEGWRASCPLLPYDFFHLPSVKALALACLCFYATYGAWLYESAEFFQLPVITGGGVKGVHLALWYTPTALGGVVLCIVGGFIIHIVPIMALLLLSALAWIVAPLLLAMAPLPLSYWSYVVPSMLCATIGIDLTFTVSIVYLSSIQPLKYQGLAGAVCSILVNLAMSFALSVSEIVSEAAVNARNALSHDQRSNSHSSAAQGMGKVRGIRAAFIYGAASAGLGLMICVLFVRLSRSSVKGKPPDQEASTALSSELTLVNEDVGGWEIRTGNARAG